MAVTENNRKFKRYVLLGSFLGGLVGATIALLAFPQSPDERKKTIVEIQSDLFKPIKSKFNELVTHVGDTLIKAIDEAAKAAANGKINPYEDN